MKTVYRGHEIDVHRDRCLGCWDMLYFSITRVSDGYECECEFSFEYSAEKVRDKVKQLKERIDNELAEEDPWGE